MQRDYCLEKMIRTWGELSPYHPYDAGKRLPASDNHKKEATRQLYTGNNPCGSAFFRISFSIYLP
jgi:hypothetical protein